MPIPSAGSRYAALSGEQKAGCYGTVGEMLV